ncbi:ATP-binding protein [Flavobacterium sp. WC2421]|uniref:ATP-binding protein n=1 Tax=Flavobacterium sp. WC2421 TaxID=3234138 RepID=UPI0034657C1C
MTAKQRIEEYLKNNNIRTNRFYGKCIPTENGFLVVGDILSKEEGNLLLREDGDRLQLFTGKENTFFEANKFYEFSIYIPVEQSKKEVVVVIDHKISPPIEISIDPYQEIVRLRYERLDNPEANKMIANLMREIGKGLYSSKQRMIFELLQNADDTPAGNEVSFHIDAYYDYLLIMHNGLPFNQDDVEAITSAAESTKRNDRKKTGYKGIGFKSVFTDSEEVLIKSGGFLFVFKRNHPAYKNFDSFYFGKKRYIDYPLLLDEDKLKYAKQRKSFNGNTDIPWQLIPVWSEELPKSLENSRLATYNNNVGFAIKFGREKVEEYLEAVANFADSPHFMLFLRHVNTFKSFKNAITIRKSGENPVIIERIAQVGINTKLTYFKKEIDDIKVNDEALAEEGVIIFKRQKENEYGEISHYFSSDIEGEKPLESIPPKLAAFDETSITFAAPVVNGIIKAEPNYISGKSFSSFYTFLPMKEMRISLPFLINADFVPSADRESLQGDNEWNEYIISKIAFNHLRWLKEIAEDCIKTKIKQPEYLSLLLKEMLPDDFTIRMLIEKYNSTYRKSIDEVDFIINDKDSLCKISEIVIDTTGISNLLGSEFFYSIANTEKHLPNSEINSHYLLYDYLEIEKFNSDELIEVLNADENKELLSIAIQNLKQDNYLSFLKWLDNFCKKNYTDSNWILALPFIRIGNELLSLNEALNVADFIFKTSKTKSIESLLVKIGFKLSEFYSNADDYKHIYAAILTQDSYLKTDLKLYEHIAAAKGLGKLTAEEKNALLTFLEGLFDVGAARYAKSLALFESKKMGGVLNPLNSLISNTCVNIPIWLSNFVIDQKEQNALSEVFKKNLLKQEDVLEKVFCNLATFNEIITGINTENIEDFYTYIFKLYKEKPEESKIDFSQIPWVFTLGTNSFVLPTTVYWPDSMAKLSAESYVSVKAAIETLSTEVLPHYAAMQLKVPFGLGSKAVNISTTFSKPSTFDVLPINHFLDWLQSEGEKTFFTKFSIIKTAEQYTIAPSAIVQYYTDNQDLVTFIESSSLNTKLVLLPTEVYAEDRKKIGLLQGTDLLKYGFENGMAIPSFAKFIYKANNAELSLHYLSLLETFNIDTTKTYNSESDEFKIIKLAVLNVVADEEKLKSFREKITIDDIPLLEKAISDDVRLYQKEGKTIELNIKLKEILKSYKDKVYSVTDIINRFINFKDDRNLIILFKAQGKSVKIIYNELCLLKPAYYNPIQTFFLSFYKSHYPAEEVFKDKIPFSVNGLTNQPQYEKDICEFLDICLNEDNYIGFIKHNVIPDFNPTNYILNEEYAIESEKPPLWLLDWVNTSDPENKLTYIKLLGINDDSKPVVLFRKAIKESDLEVINLNRESIENNFLLINTLTWLSEQQTKNNLVLKKEILQPLYKKLENKKIPVIGLPFPSITILNVDNYTLIQLQENAILHLIHEGWGEYKQDIFSSLTGENKVTDDVVPPTYRISWKIVVQKFVSEADIIKLQNNSYPFDEDYYLEWELKDKYKIVIYKGSHLPYVIKYNESIIKTVEDKFVAYINGIYYVIENNIEYLFLSFTGVLDLSILRSLGAERQRYIEKKKKKEFDVEYTDEETEALNRLFGDEIPKNFHKDLNIAALISALIYLAKNGFDVTEAENNLKDSHIYSQLSPVYSSDKTENYTVMGRSAKTGLLYLTANAWERLASDDIKLFVSTGKREQNHHLFNNKQELLNVSDTNFQVFRVAANSTATNTDSILNGTFDKNKVLLIFKMKENRDYNSIFGGGIRENENTPDYENVNTYEDSEY